MRLVSYTLPTKLLTICCIVRDKIFMRKKFRVSLMLTLQIIRNRGM